jgi:hypothetical protein
MDQTVQKPDGFIDSLVARVPVVVLAIEFRIYEDLPTSRIKRCMLASMKPGTNFLCYGGCLQLSPTLSSRPYTLTLPFANCDSLGASWLVGCERGHRGTLPHLQRGVDQTPS